MGFAGSVERQAAPRNLRVHKVTCSDLSCAGSRCSNGGRAWLLVEKGIVVVLFILDQQACILSTHLHASHTTKSLQPPLASIVRPVINTRGQTAGGLRLFVPMVR